ncbi:hypothetical protein [Agaribacter flavus]|uniref:Glycosyltransferase n=1 Tax=Agaribacter flavus TaxID=1902781 RepID=A0ABV7FKK4_9ALTE
MANAKKTHIVCYPRVNNTNQYIDLNTRIWKGCGFSVEQTDLLLSEIRHVLTIDKQSVLILNWFEDRVSYRSSALLEIIKSTFILIVCRFKFRKIIWVRHNLNPHSGKAFRWFSLLRKLLSSFSDAVVAHRPTQQLDIEYIPHPLYLPKAVLVSRASATAPFLIVGVVKKYKGIVELLSVWPANLTIRVVGKCSDSDLEKEIHTVIQSRKLNCTFVNAFLSAEELEREIKSAKFVVLPHADNSMLVTGVYFHAISLGVPCLISKGDFGHYIKSEIGDTPLFSRTTIANDLELLADIDREALVQQSQNNFNDARIESRWLSIVTYL